MEKFALARRAIGGLILASLVVIASSAFAQLSGQEIYIGVGAPLTTGSATFGVEMRQAIDLAVAERNAVGGVLGAKIVVDVLDDEANNAKGEAVAKVFCENSAVLGVLGHVNSGVTIAASKVYAGCGLPMITPMSSNPAVTDNGLLNVFRLTNRDDHKGPGLAAYIIERMGKRRAVVIDDGTQYGKGLADSFVKGFEAKGGTISARLGVKVGDTQFADVVRAYPRISTFSFSPAFAKAPRSSRRCAIRARTSCSPVAMAAGTSKASSAHRPAPRKKAKACASSPQRRLWERSRALPNSQRRTRPSTVRSTITRPTPTIRLAC